MIKRLKSGKYQLWTKDGSRPLGPATSKERAMAQEQAIKASEARQKEGKS